MCRRVLGGRTLDRKKVPFRIEIGVPVNGHEVTRRVDEEKREGSVNAAEVHPGDKEVGDFDPACRRSVSRPSDHSVVDARRVGSPWKLTSSNPHTPKWGLWRPRARCRGTYWP